MMKKLLLKQISEKYTSLRSSCVAFGAGRGRTSNIRKMLLRDLPIAILVPHPDDEIVGCFHLINARGKTNPIDLYYITDGSASDEAVLREDLVSERANESVLATSGLVIRKRVYWNLPDSKLKNLESVLQERLMSLVSCYSDGYVFCPAKNDLTRDHAVLARCAASVFDDDTLVWYRSTWLTFPLHTADFIEFGNAKKKLEALLRFKSQSGLALANSIYISRAEARINSLDVDSLEAFRLASSGECSWKPLNTLSIFAINKLRRWLENPSD